MSRIVVLGGGESGVGAAVLAKVKGFDVFLSDNGKIPEHFAEDLRNGASALRKAITQKSLSSTQTRS